MKIAMLATSDGGGAGRAAVRLMSGLNRFSDVDVYMIVKDKRTANDSIKQIGMKTPFFDYISRHHFANNVPQNHVLTSLMYSGTENEYLQMTGDADIVHLHWVANFVSAESIRYMDEVGTKLVWTFHDRNPMTGGCHCTYGCVGYEKDCNCCPEMVKNPYNISKYLLAIKKKINPKKFGGGNPSRWMADCARKSAVFKNHRIEVIPNSVDTDLFRPLDKKACRERLGIDNNAKVILYCAEAPEQIHKGYRFFLEAMQWIKKELSSERWEKIRLLLIGKSDIVLKDTEQLGVTVIPLGYIKDDDLLAASYAAADVTALSSLEDNFPNVMLESISCGTPVASFMTGGVPDVIRDGVNGYVVPQEDSQALGEAIIKILKSSGMEAACRRFTEENLALELQAKRYKDLYYDMLSRRKRTRTISVTPFDMPLETHKVLAPYYWSAIQHLLTLDDLSARRFLKGISLEDDVLSYAGRHTDWVKSCPDDSVAIWGAGKFSKRLLETLLTLEVSFDKKMRGFFDTTPKGSSIFGYPYLSLEDISKGKISTIVIGSPKFENEIYRQIQKYEELGVRILRLRWSYENASLI